MEHMNEIIDLDTLVNQLNDQIGHMGNNLIQVVEELDYLKEEYLKLIQINKRLINELYEKNNRIHRHDIRNTVMRY
jgi:hypothetical protein